MTSLYWDGVLVLFIWLMCVLRHPNTVISQNGNTFGGHDDVMNWKHFPRYWPFVRGIHRSPVKSLHKGQWRGAFMVSLICDRINLWVNNREAGDLRRYRAHYDIIVMVCSYGTCCTILPLWFQFERNLFFKLSKSWNMISTKKLNMQW